MKSRFAFAITVGCSVAIPAAAIAEDIQLQFSAIPISMAPPDGVGGGGGKPGGGGGGNDGGGGTEPPHRVFDFMHGDVPLAWTAGYDGAGATITVIDNFDSNYFRVNLDGGKPETMSHGNIVRSFATLTAPGAIMVRREYDASTAVALGDGLDVINLSFGLQDLSNGGDWYESWMNVDADEDGAGDLNGDLYHVQEAEIIRLARIDTSVAGADEAAVIVKAAGNGDAFGNGGVIGTSIGGWVDLLGYELMYAPNVIFAGALSENSTLNADGTVSTTATLAGYSNHPGDNLAIRAQFLVVGVDKSDTAIEGTSFAAPIISGYAAIVGHKFTSLSGQPAAGLVVNRLLATAREDTIFGYDPYYHGQGEASLGHALAPDSIYGN